MITLGRFVFALICVAAFGIFSVPSTIAESSKLVWFAPESHYPPAKDSDFLEIFRQPDAWSHAAKHVQIFEVSTQTLVAAPDSVVTEIVRFLKDHNIALGLAGEFVCGKAPGTPEVARTIVEKVQKAEGNIDFIAMDEPLYHDHYSTQSGACQLPIADTASRVASIINVYTAAFPKIIVGDVEPFPAVSVQPDWQADYAAWLQAFEKATGRPIRFLHLDFNWRDAHLTKGNPDISNPDAIISLAKTVATYARSKRLMVGMIFDGKATAQSDLEWIQQAQANIDIIAKSKIDPDHLVFQSWHQHPKKALPDSDPAAFSALIANYFGAR